MKDLVGTLLGGRYDIKEIIGVGGMSIVYKAFDSLENRFVAVKVLKEEYVSDTRFRKRFLNESRAIAMLSHRNIVDVYDVNFEGDVQYIVMEFIDGRTLKEYIDYTGALSVPEAIGYCKQILKALRHAHERGVVHRDVKPHNIMLLDDGTIKVADFGIAHVSNFETVTMTDTAIGSVHYISPEQARGLATDERSDIYSTGVMLYEMVTGKLPFTGDSAVAVALQQVQSKPMPPRKVMPSLPEGLEQVILRAMMKDPEKRYQHARDMLVDLKIIEDDRTAVFAFDLNDTLPEENPAPKNTDTDNKKKNVKNASTSETKKQTKTVTPDKKDKPQGSRKEETNKKNSAGKTDKKGKNNEKEYNWRIFRNKLIAGSAGILLALLLVIVGYGAMHTLVNSLSKELVIVPSFIGKPAEDVMNDVRYTVNFTFDTVREYDSTFGEGLIINQTPDANSKYPSGTKITLTVSRGKRSSVVPSVSGMPENQAIVAIKQKNLLYEIIREKNDTVQEGTVLRTSPSEGQTVYEETTIKIYVAFRSTVTQVYVPEVVNYTKEKAITKLLQAKLLYEQREEYSDTVEAGYVIRQSIEKNTIVDQGTQVIIYISLGPAPEQERSE